MVTRPCHLRELDFTTHCYEYFTDGCKKLLQRMHENSVNNVVVCGGQDSYFPLIDADTLPDANMIMTMILQTKTRLLPPQYNNFGGSGWIFVCALILTM